LSYTKPYVARIEIITINPWHYAARKERKQMVATKLLNTFNSHIYFYLKSVIAYWEGNFYGGSDLCNFLRMLALPRNNSETTTGY